VKYNDVQTNIETYVKATCATLGVSVSYENVPFSSDVYTKYVQMTVQFGEAYQRAVERCYRVVGILLLDLHTRPSTGVVPQLTLADQLTPYLIKHILVSTPPPIVPAIQFLVPELKKGDKEMNGWVIDHLRCPFYYNVEF
jgi:hypothetical protein